ncbi:beta-N-acetylhexosaminidase [Aspergillus brunneoviolaceus CBS 621.78]|uniref:Beta-N-hexosaminidase n=1 Tax=Aspergillus brunneoviolaceus CBS 621.78 TaxID=1450534 RepID=A0ACD1G5X7_9EURO|nr:putative beta-N-hexosaminidase [Aspergillus brunneoviolaceus CBS 621.78]RAH44667.1 putative beta-N-hexosaminidase [Aspergillus brunneoviolaceus CBS 621.78]
MKFVAFPYLAAVACALQVLPPVAWNATGLSENGFDIKAIERKIFITSSFSIRRDDNGLTLIPPSAGEFAETFRQDLQAVTNTSWVLHTVDAFSDSETGIFLDSVAQQVNLTYENKEPTEEGYELVFSAGRAYIRGSGARGMWWGTRTFLQQLLIHDVGIVPAGRTLDAPSSVTRGFLLDAGRKWYSPGFLRDLCTYASFFKLSEFHYHSSDNYPLNRGHNETWYEVYSQFSLRPESAELQGLVQRQNETLSRAEFEDFQYHCAQRGVTVIPEIEAPGHSLSITKWKPELALEPKDLLNLTHPDTLPLIKSIWTEFLPWFQTKEVHIGADEYDSALADDYIDFVNEMAAFMNETAGKRVRIWGTYEPSNTHNISKNVIIQHWQYGQSDPVSLARDGFELINSEDWWAYMSLKNDHMPIIPAPYPPSFNNTRLLNFGGSNGLQWTPPLFNPYNLTKQPDPRRVQGAIIAAWNDNGPDATTQLEAYYALRDGIPTFASRVWAGNRGQELNLSSLSETMRVLTANAVAQNLDRRLSGAMDLDGDVLVSWDAMNENATTKHHLGYGSKGMNYSLELNVTGPFTLSSDDATLKLGSDGSLTFVSDGWEYPLRSVSEADGYDPAYPGRIWVNETTSTHEPVTVPLGSLITIQTDVVGGSRIWIDGLFVGRFEVFVFGGKNTLFSWSQMAFVAPLEWVEGGVRHLRLKPYDGNGNQY